MSKQEWLKEMYRLREVEDAAWHEYYRLRDAKSNGCCVGMKIAQIEDYDDSIRAAYDAYAKAQDDFRKHLDKKEA